MTANALFDLDIVGDPEVIERNRQEFLWSLRSDSSGRYRRYLASPLRYAGGKSIAVGLILELLPAGVTTLCSPFMGGGSVEIACAKALGMRVHAYDVFDVLCSYWQRQLADPLGLHLQMKDWAPDRETFAAVKERLRQHWEGERRLDDLDLAAHYYFNSNMSYGPHFLWWPSDLHLTLSRWRVMLDKVRRFSASGLSVECLDFHASLVRHRDDFLYCDPPYHLDEGRTFTGMYPNRNHPVHHRGFDHEGLRDLLRQHRGGFILSYNDCELIRDWYADCMVSAPSWHYTFGQGDRRIGPNRSRDNEGSYVKSSHELLLYRPPC